jgi:hypothetical protein
MFDPSYSEFNQLNTRRVDSFSQKKSILKKNWFLIQYHENSIYIIKCCCTETTLFSWFWSKKRLLSKINFFPRWNIYCRIKCTYMYHDNDDVNKQTRMINILSHMIKLFDPDMWPVCFTRIFNPDTWPRYMTRIY